MEIQEYVDQMKELQNYFLSFLDNSEYDEEDYEKLNQYIKDLEIQKKRSHLQIFLQLIVNISNNHHRESGFFIKIEKILLLLKTFIKQTLSNSVLFNIFHSNKRLILFLLNSGIITIDESIFYFLIESEERPGSKICHFFIPEINNYIKDKNIEINDNELFEFDENFMFNYEEKRLTGENDSYICKLIREDSVEEFISFTTRTNISLKSQIPTSIFETNSILILENPTLIEYAAFFGANQIIRYLFMNNVELSSSLWIYSIHSKNAELIHFLEENHVSPNKTNDFNKCFIESIKCNHNDIASYIFDNLLKLNTMKSYFFEDCIQYYNFSFFSENFTQNNIFINLCKFNYLYIIKSLMLIKKDEIEKAKTVKYF